MKRYRKMYLTFFIYYCLSLVLLFRPQWIAAQRIPQFFGIVAVCFAVSTITEIIRSRKEGVAFSRLIPACIVVLIFLVQNAGSFWWFYTAADHEPEIFLFYLITALLNMAVSAVGFFLK